MSGLDPATTAVTYVGVDQTGAARAGGRRAAPLPVATLTATADGWRLVAARDGRPTTWPTLAEEHAAGARTVFVDAVLGLPAARATAWGVPPGAEGVWALARRAAQHAERGPRAFGRDVAAAFFAGCPEVGPDLREVDRAVGAWSVFRTTPYQRNVQTGTYRILVDLGRATARWARLWPFEPPDDRPALVEAWPTAGWRALGMPTRRPMALPARLEALGVRVDPTSADVLARRPDHADAAVNAVHGALLAQAGCLALPETGRGVPSDEGWIAGVPVAVGASVPGND